MKKYRTKSEWLALIDEFEQSGLTQTEFCAQRELNAKYFSLRRMKLKAQPESSGFTQAVVSKPQVTDQVTLHYGAVTVKLPASNAQTIAQLVKALAA